MSSDATCDNASVSTMDESPQKSDPDPAAYTENSKNGDNNNNDDDDSQYHPQTPTMSVLSLLTVFSIFKKFDAGLEVLDVDRFRLSEPMHVTFTNLGNLLNCKKSMDKLYETSVQSKNKVLKLPEFRSFKPSHQPLGHEGKPFMTVEEVREAATKHKPKFDALLRRIVQNMGLNPDAVVMVGGKPIHKGDITYKVLTLVPLKSLERCRDKTRDDYGGNAKNLCDVGRATIVCFTEEQIATILREFRKLGIVVRLKNRFDTPTYTGIHDVLMNILVNGHVFEIQIHQADMLAEDTRNHGHLYYEHFRAYFVGSTETYKDHMELFDELGDAMRTAKDANDGVREILRGTDRTKLLYLNQSALKFGDSNLQMVVLQRLWKIANTESASERFGQNGYIEEAAAQLGFMFAIGVIYQEIGRYPRSIEIFHYVLAGRKLVLGENHDDVFDTLHWIAGVYQHQGHYKLALEGFEKVLRHRTSRLGVHHADTLRTAGMIAFLHFRLENYETSLAIYEENLLGRKLVFGENDLETLATMDGMATVYSALGDHQKAIDICDEVLQKLRATHGQNHPETLMTLNNLAAKHGKLGNHDTAIELLQEVVRIRTLVYSADHPSTLLSMYNLAIEHYWQGRVHTAMELSEYVLAIQKARLGGYHPDTVRTKIDRATWRPMQYFGWGISCCGTRKAQILCIPCIICSILREACNRSDNVQPTAGTEQELRPLRQQTMER